MGFSIRSPIHVVFHFALYDDRPDPRAVAFGEQIRMALQQVSGTAIKLYATTQPLCDQLLSVGVDASAIPYPTRQAGTIASRFSEDRSRPLKLLMAGIPRAEKGRDAICGLISKIEQPLLQTGKLSLAMQLPTKRWERYLPKTIDLESEMVQVLNGNLSNQQYHDWLNQADVGLFLYDSRRYVARCSGVLLEMLSRGIPVIVPDHCWLADQVRTHSQRGSVGWIYSNVDEIPDLLPRVVSEYRLARDRCRQRQPEIASRHSGRSTLLAMGIPDQVVQSSRVAG